MAASPRTEALVVTGLGMVSSLGQNVVGSCAAARAGLLLPTTLKSLAFGIDELFGPEGFDGPPTVAGHTVPGIGVGFAGVGKAIALGVVALRDLIERRPLNEREHRRTGFYVAGSDYFIQDAGAERYAAELGSLEPPKPKPSERWRQQSSSLARRLLDGAGLAGITDCKVIHGGHAGFASALAEAVARLQHGTLDRVVVGGVESRVEPAFLTAAARVRALKTKDNAVGLTPGEAAAFVMIERARDAEKGGLRALAELRGVAETRDPGHAFSDLPADGATLADAIRQLLEVDTDLRGRLGLFIGDMNGVERRALDWGHALVRLRSTLSRGLDTPLWLPAASFGDTGAATGAIGICLAARAFEREYAPSAGAVIWLSSESGSKGAVGLVATSGR